MKKCPIFKSLNNQYKLRNQGLLKKQTIDEIYYETIIVKPILIFNYKIILFRIKQIIL